MSLTQTHHVFVGVEESGINTFLHALFTARPHYLNYGSPFFVPTSTVTATSVSAIPFPGVPGGIQFDVSFSVPTVNLYPPDPGSTSPIPPGPNQFGLHTSVTIVLGCMTWGQETNLRSTVSISPISATLDVWALGTPTSQYSGPGTGSIGLQVLDVRIPAIQPEKFEAIIDCLIRMLLNAVLANVQLPFHALSLGAFTLILEAGPEIDNHEVEVWGSI
ncbi:MAG TPA: hypothetical protein VIY49_25455 [Bryobacteraceae bacterium]